MEEARHEMSLLGLDINALKDEIELNAEASEKTVIAQAKDKQKINMFQQEIFGLESERDNYRYQCKVLEEEKSKLIGKVNLIYIWFSKKILTTFLGKAEVKNLQNDSLQIISIWVPNKRSHKIESKNLFKKKI